VRRPVLHAIAQRFRGSECGAAQRFEVADRAERQRGFLDRDHTIAKRQPSVPLPVDHRVVGDGAGIDARQAVRAGQPGRDLVDELDARREASHALVVGGLPEPSPVAGRQRDRHRDGALGKLHAIDPDPALGGKPCDRSFDEAPDCRIVGSRGSGNALPSACLQHEEILDALCCAHGLARGIERHRCEVVETATLAHQLFAAARRCALVVPVVSGLEQRPAVAIEGGAVQSMARQDAIKGTHERSVVRQQRQQQQRGRRRIVAEMVEPACDDRLGVVAIDQRRAERSVRMHPSHRRGQHGMPEAGVARGKKAHQPAVLRPHQQCAAVPTEHRRCGGREIRPVEHVGFESAGFERAPLIGDRLQRA